MAQLQSLSKAQCCFLQVLLPTLLVVRGKVNFLKLSRYCVLHERTLMSAPCGGTFALSSTGLSSTD
jgi:hypothetical protein